MSTTLRLTIDQYEQMIARDAFANLDKRIEFIDGELLQMSPAGPVHDDYIRYLLSWAQSSKLSIPHCQMGIRVGDHLPEPDIALLSPRRYAHERPTQADVLLIIEVSDSSLSFDLNEKAQLYAEHNIPEYWVVDIASSLLHQHRSPTRGRYRESTRLASPETTSPLFDSAMSLDLQDFFLPDAA